MKAAASAGSNPMSMRMVHIMHQPPMIRDDIRIM
jgi:hypothetical protein